MFTASFMHETHSFSPVPADLDSFRRTGYHVGDEIPRYFRGTRTELGAVLVLAERYGWDLVHPISGHSRDQRQRRFRLQLEAAEDASTT
ncbi:M81 family metallopeptidase [Variovorax sp. LjRoot84]|uniref:M81 family metallopeptidase n=1 Tax=Variovorax sp. LjRoot84 TaxID=3342340 RepID=UPI003ED0FB22